jgi:hypothetical protein
MRSRNRSLITILPVLLLSSLSWLAVGCADDEGAAAPACTQESWRGCPAPSIALRSRPWPELRLRLAELAEATEQVAAAADPRRVVISRARTKPDASQLYEGWHGVVWTQEKQARYDAILDADTKHFVFLGDLDNLVFSPSPMNVQSAGSSALRLKNGYASLQREEMFVDPFGQPEPRSALFVFARAATVLQLLSPASARRAIATDAAAVLEKRIEQWAAMQRELLAGRPAAEVEQAIESIGVPEIRRLVAAWRGLESPAILAIVD